MHGHNEEEEVKGRNANCPCARLKFQIFLTVVILQSVDNDASQHMHNVLALCISIL